jgi:hypothetical protein
MQTTHRPHPLSCLKSTHLGQPVYELGVWQTSVLVPSSHFRLSSRCTLPAGVGYLIEGTHVESANPRIRA